MRLLIKLSANNTFPYDLSYHHNLQAFIYHLIKRAGYNYLHDRKGYKFFSFSNIIPPSRTIQSGSMRNLIVASPNRNLIKALFTRYIKNAINLCKNYEVDPALIKEIFEQKYQTAISKAKISSNIFTYPS